MANEAVIIELGPNGGMPVRYTVADGTSISKGTLLKVADPRTASAATGAGEAFAGIAAADKVASDGSTTLAAYTEGIFDLKVAASGPAAMSTGDYVIMSGANLIASAYAGANSGGYLLRGAVVGKALEDGSLSEVIAVKLGY